MVGASLEKIRKDSRVWLCTGAAPSLAPFGLLIVMLTFNTKWSITIRIVRKLLLSKWHYFKRKRAQRVLAAAILPVATSWPGPLCSGVCFLLWVCWVLLKKSTGTQRCGIHLEDSIRPLCHLSALHLALPHLSLQGFPVGMRDSPPCFHADSSCPAVWWRSEADKALGQWGVVSI